MTLEDFLTEWRADSTTVSVKTSGSTGTPKEMAVEKSRMVASAQMTCSFLGLKGGERALLCLPLEFIAGKMMVVRAVTCGLNLVSIEPCGHPLTDVDETIDFAAMVPMQVWNSLEVPAERKKLEKIGHLIIGGGGIDDVLADKLKLVPVSCHVWSTYGMTETLSHIAMRRLNGEEASEWYRPLEGVKLDINKDNCLIINAPSVCRETIITHDVVEMRTDGSFRVIGRSDNIICSGGLKIQAEEVERRLKQYTKVPLCVTARRDHRLGEALVLIVQGTDVDDIEQLCRRVLPRYWCPRNIIKVAQLPMTANGKIARQEARLLASQPNSALRASSTLRTGCSSI